MSLFVRPAAGADIEEAFVWYEGQRPGLGDDSLDAIRTVFEVLEESPRRYRVVHRDTRRANLRRFPYGVFYRMIRSEVVVLAIIHLHRDPAHWRNR